MLLLYLEVAGSLNCLMVACYPFDRGLSYEHVSREDRTFLAKGGWRQVLRYTGRAPYMTPHLVEGHESPVPPYTV